MAFLGSFGKFIGGNAKTVGGLFGIGGQGAPPAPNYTESAKDQGQANIDAARIQARLNNPNVMSPYGTQTVSWSNDTPTLTQTFSPSEQAIYNLQNTSQKKMGELGITGLNNAQGVLGEPIDYSGAPAMPADMEQVRRLATAAMMVRPQEDYARNQDQLNSNLIAAGIRPGSKAYDDQMNLLNRQLTDAQMQAQVFGGQEASRQQQLAQQARQQWLGEYQAKRTQPLNEIASLVSGSQVSNPFAMPGYAQNAQVQPAPIFGASQLLGQYNTDMYNAKMAQQGNLMSGLFGLGGAGLMGLAMSDRRLKSNIRRIGTHSIGVPLYRYSIFGRDEIGVMADELRTQRPDAVHRHPTGYLMVDYAAIGGRT